MASKLALYNAALKEIGETRLASLVEVRGPRYELDECYDEAVKYCLERGQWNFAMRTVQMENDDSAEPQFRYTYGFEKPTDWLRTSGLSASETMHPPLLDYVDERGYWFANVTPLFVRYVSDHADYGLDLTGWPSSFTRFVELYLASRICKPVAESESTLERILKDLKKAQSVAMSMDAMNEPVAFAPTGSWQSARAGNSWSGRRYLRA